MSRENSDVASKEGMYQLAPFLPFIHSSTSFDTLRPASFTSPPPFTPSTPISYWPWSYRMTWIQRAILEIEGPSLTHPSNILKFSVVEALLPPMSFFFPIQKPENGGISSRGYPMMLTSSTVAADANSESTLNAWGPQSSPPEPREIYQHLAGFSPAEGYGLLDLLYPFGTETLSFGLDGGTSVITASDDSYDRGAKGVGSRAFPASRHSYDDGFSESRPESMGHDFRYRGLPPFTG